MGIQQPFTMQAQLGRTLEDVTLQVIDMLPKLGLPYIKVVFWYMTLRIDQTSTVESVAKDLESQLHIKRCTGLILKNAKTGR